jgi:competence protein ComEA
LIDLNTASVELLETLPSIGEVRAKAIANYRETNGCFQATSDVTKVSGICSGIYEQIRDLVTANGCS